MLVTTRSVKFTATSSFGIATGLEIGNDDVVLPELDLVGETLDRNAVHLNAAERIFRNHIIVGGCRIVIFLVVGLQYDLAVFQEARQTGLREDLPSVVQVIPESLDQKIQIGIAMAVIHHVVDEITEAVVHRRSELSCFRFGRRNPDEVVVIEFQRTIEVVVQRRHIHLESAQLLVDPIQLRRIDHRLTDQTESQ